MGIIWHYEVTNNKTYVNTYLWHASLITKASDITDIGRFGKVKGRFNDIDVFARCPIKYLWDERLCARRVVYPWTQFSYSFIRSSHLCYSWCRRFILLHFQCKSCYYYISVQHLYEFLRNANFISIFILSRYFEFDSFNGILIRFRNCWIHLLHSK